MNEYMKHLIDYLTREIAKRDVSVTAFSELCGLHRNEMSRILNGRKKDICLSTLVKIATALDKPVCSLLSPDEIQKDLNAEVVKQVYSIMQQHMRKNNAA